MARRWAADNRRADDVVHGGIRSLSTWIQPVDSDAVTGGTPRPSAAQLPSRKAEHLELALDPSVEAAGGAGWRDIELLHEALPEVDLDGIDLTVDFLGRSFSAPLVIAGMTGGHAGAREINAVLARAAERHGLPIGVGSQRAALQQPALAPTYGIVREHAPGAFVIGNIGVAQLIGQDDRPPLTLQDVRTAVAMVDADAMAIHLNFLEELIQPEGDRRARGGAAAIADVVAGLDVPVIAKETGGGIAPSTARRLMDLGVAALDVGGSGGTSFAEIERLRAERQRDVHGAALGMALADWGVPTAASVAGAAPTGLPVIATGGIRSGLDAAKALALGATAVGVARPLLVAAMEGDEAVEAWIERFVRELRAVLMLTGCDRVAALTRRRLVVTGRTRAWLTDLDLRPNEGRSG
jgi:isopentenyl-diphosphate Delta-isomerase